MNNPGSFAAFERTPPDREPDYDGHLERMVGCRVEGWVYKPADSSVHVAVEVLVDGVAVARGEAERFREDLVTAGIGDGHHAFSILLPEHLFDDSSRGIAVRVVDSGWDVPFPLANVWFSSRFGGQIVGRIGETSPAAVAGHAFDPREPDAPVTLRLTADGEVLSETRADRRLASFDQDAPWSCGFLFDLTAIRTDRLLANDLVVIGPNGEFIGSVSPGSFADHVRLTVSDYPAAIKGQLSIDLDLRAPLHFDLYVDDLLVSQITLKPGARTTPIFLPLPSNDAVDECTVSVRSALGGFEVSGSPAFVDTSTERNLVSNGGFDAWTADRLDGWTLALPDGVSVLPLYRAEPDGARDPFGRGAAAIIADDAAAGIGGSSLSQAIRIGRRYADHLDVNISGRAQERTGITIVLDVIDERGGATRIAKPVVFWPKWTMTTLRFVLSGVEGRAQKGTLALTVDETAARQVAIAFVSVGSISLAAEQAPAQAPGQPSDAVINGRFQHWRGPNLRWGGRERRFETADGWVVHCKSATPSLQARLTELTTRDPRTGDPGAHAYGLALQASDLNGFARIEGSLDALQLAAGLPDRLSFYAKRATQRDRPSSEIAEVFIIEAEHVERGAQSARQDRKLCVLRRNVTIEPDGRRHVFDLPERTVEIIEKAARRALGRVGVEFKLIFEFVGAADIVIADVGLGRSPRAASLFDRISDYVAIEDPTIRSQLGLIKGLESWGDPSPLASAADGSLTPRAQAEQATWRWAREATRSVEIVIPVHEAVDDVLRCVASIRRNTTLPHTVCIVDDGSSAPTREQLRQAIRGLPWMRMVELPEQVGYTRASNVGLSGAESDWVVLLNSDTLVTPGWLEGLFDVVSARPEVAMVGPLSNAASWQSVPELRDVKGKWRVNALPPGLSADAMAEVVRELSPAEFPDAPLLNGFCTLIRADVLRAVGYLDEVAFPVGYGEENDLCIRVAQAGHGLAIADHVYVYHVKSATFGAARRDDLSKQGTKAFQKKHPDVDLTAIQDVLAELTSLTILRKRLRERFGA